MAVDLADPERTTEPLPTTAAIYDALLLAADETRRRGQLCRAEALLRRALALCDGGELPGARDPGGALRRHGAWLAESMRCDPGLAAAPLAAHLPTCTTVLVDFSYALMQFDAHALTHDPALEIADRWILLSPIASGGGKLAARCAILLDAIMAHHNRLMAAADPHGSTYIGVCDVRARLIGGAEVRSLAPDLRSPTWAASSLYIVAGARFAPLTAAEVIALACD